QIRTKWPETRGIRDTSLDLFRRLRSCSLLDLVRLVTSAILLRADSPQPSDIAPIELHKSKPPGPLVSSILGSAPSGAEPNDTSGRRTSPIPHKKSSRTHGLFGQEPGKQIHEKHGTDARDPLAG